MKINSKYIRYIQVTIVSTFMAIGISSEVFAKENNSLNQKNNALNEVYTEGLSVKQKSTKQDVLLNNQEVSNLLSTVKQGGAIMILIILLGFLAMVIVLERFFYFTKKKLWSKSHLQDYLNTIAKNSETQFKEDMVDELSVAYSVYKTNLEKGLGLLNGIANLSPIVGFLGTVLGMITAFASIAAATTVNAKVVAVGIQVALVTTAGGLIVASPALLSSYFFSHILERKHAIAEVIIEDLSSNLNRISDVVGVGDKLDA